MKKNIDILNILKRRRKVSTFAKFLDITPQGVYKLLQDEKTKNNQYWNYIEFIMKEFEDGKH